jgi:hypothetical protein
MVGIDVRPPVDRRTLTPEILWESDNTTDAEVTRRLSTSRAFSR